jgi:hypothetical protein
MSHWWRAYDECVDDPKLIMLSDRAHRAWFNLLCIASANGGVLPGLKIMAVKLRMAEARVAGLIHELMVAELIDERDGVLMPHNWNARQYKSDVSTDRVKRFRERQRNVSETPPETDTEAEAEKEASLSTSLASRKLVSIKEGGAAKSDEPPRHCAQTSKGGGRVYVVKGTSEWEAYAADYRAARGEEPNVNEHGGRWFKKLGEQFSKRA